MRKIRVAAWLLTYRKKVNRARVLIHVQHFGDIAFALRDLIFQVARRQVVKVKLAPIVALAEPEDLVGLRQILPVHLPIAALEKLRSRLAHHFANVACLGVGHAQPLLPVVPRGGDKCEMVAVGAPLHILPGGAAACDIVAQRRAVLIGRHFQANHLR